MGAKRHSELPVSEVHASEVRASQVRASQVRAAVSGDRTATEQVLRMLVPRVRNLVRYLIRGDRDVDDIAQEALIAIARGLPGFRGEGTVEAWSDRIVARATFAHLRKQRADVGLAAYSSALSAVPDMDEARGCYATRRQLAGYLDQLPVEQRHALVLHHVMGMSVPEIASELALSAETVRSRLRLGKKKLRTMYGYNDAKGSERP